MATARSRRTTRVHDQEWVPPRPYDRICAVGLGLVAGCGTAETTAGFAGTTTAPAPQGTPAPAPAGTMAPLSGTSVPTSGDFAGLIDIGEGRTMYLECSGTGSPTVVLITGNGLAADGWRYSGGSETDEDNPSTQNHAAVYPTTAKFTRVCAYDRPGTQLVDGARSRSSTVKQPTTVQGDAADLHALLTAAGIHGPYVLVGHSLGGFIATIYARTFPDDVTGIVLVDAASQYLETTLGPAVFSQWAEAFLSRLPSDPDGEAPDMVAGAEAINDLAPLPAIPASVLTAQAWSFASPNCDGEPERDYWPQWFEAQEILATSLNATHITQTNSGHNIFIENAALVNEQICAVIRPAKDC
jgi:pimeloyl-ACP methyl ester carboxylesterase